MNEGAVMGEQNSKSATGGEVSIGPKLVLDQEEEMVLYNIKCLNSLIFTQLIPKGLRER